MSPEAEQRPELLRHPFRLLRVGNRLVDDALELGRRLLLGRTLEDSRVRLQDLGESPERDALAVGQAPALAPVDQLWLRLDGGEELVDEPALPDPGHPDERHELGRALLAYPGEGVDEQIELSLPPDQRGARLIADVFPKAGTGLDRLPDGYRLRLASGLGRRALAVLDHAGCRVVRRFADEDAVHRRLGLQPRGGVDHVTGDEPALRPHARLERDERLAGVDGDAHLQLALVADPVADRERRTDGALRIVLVCDGRAEDRHDGVADELLDRAAAALELGAQPLVIRPQDRFDVLGVE